MSPHINQSGHQLRRFTGTEEASGQWEGGRPAYHVEEQLLVSAAHKLGGHVDLRGEVAVGSAHTTGLHRVKGTGRWATDGSSRVLHTHTKTRTRTRMLAHTRTRTRMLTDTHAPTPTRTRTRNPTHTHAHMHEIPRKRTCARTQSHINTHYYTINTHQHTRTSARMDRWACTATCSSGDSLRTLGASENPRVPDDSRATQRHMALQTCSGDVGYASWRTDLFTNLLAHDAHMLLWLSIPSGFLVVFEKPNRSSFTFTFTFTRTRKHNCPNVQGTCQKRRQLARVVPRGGGERTR
jgi:hypothetical protein